MNQYEELGRVIIDKEIHYKHKDMAAYAALVDLEIQLKKEIYGTTKISSDSGDIGDKTGSN